MPPHGSKRKSCINKGGFRVANLCNQFFILPVLKGNLVLIGIYA